MEPRFQEAASKVCVIGAGVSGLATAKYLHQADIPFDCFDERESVGGVWAYTEKSGITCAWRSLNQNSPRGTYAYSDFPMPEYYADFPTAAEVCEYLNGYVDHFGFRHHIHLATRVVRITPLPDGSWQVTNSSGQTRNYSAVVIANGHHNQPRYPLLEGHFTGTILHSQNYRHREAFLGKRVLVVGFGDSGSQIAVDISHASEQTLLSVRHGAWVLPHFIRGKPYSAWINPPWWAYEFIPARLRGTLLSAYYRLLLGRPNRFGLPMPDHPFGAALPTVCDGLHDRIGDGRIVIKPEVRRFDECRVVFADGTEEFIDAIVACTGYETTFPFLSREMFSADENRVRLYKRTFLPRYPGLCFVGAFQAMAPAFVPVFEAQARLVVACLDGTYVLPPVEEMERDIERDLALTQREFVRSPRNNYQVNGPVFIHSCEAELKRSRSRTRARRKEVPQASLTALS